LSIASELAPVAQPRELLVGDEGNSALHYLNAASPDRNWSYRGPGRDLQLIGKNRVLRSHPQGYVELDLERGAVLREVSIAGIPGGVESARRLANGNTVIIGNGAGGVFLWEIGSDNRVLTNHRVFCEGIDKARLVRQTAEGTFLFCSETEGRSIIHEAHWTTGARALFEVPSDVAADSMVKAVRISADVITVSTGYAASLLRIDTAQKKVLQILGGKAQPSPPEYARPLSPFFFSGYQMFASGDYLISNWQGHSAAKNEQGYQLLRYDREGRLLWSFDQTAYPFVSSLNNVIALDGLDVQRLHDEPRGILVPID
jgi:hypothetical protein